MKSLLERPFYLAAVVAIIAVAAILWWLLGPQASTVTTTETVTNTNAPVLSAAQRSDNESATATTATATSEITPTHTVAPVTTANVALPTDPALAEEELDRLNDEHARLNDRKSQLAQQLEISNKLLAMKEQQVKTLETANH